MWKMGISEQGLRRISIRLLANDDKTYSLNDPNLMYIGEFAKMLKPGRYPGKDIGYPTIVTAYYCPSDGPGKPEVVDIVAARSASQGYEGGEVEYLDLMDGRHISSLYVFPLDAKPEYLMFEDDFGTFHNWAAFKDTRWDGEPRNSI